MNIFEKFVDSLSLALIAGGGSTYVLLSAVMNEQRDKSLQSGNHFLYSTSIYS